MATDECQHSDVSIGYACPIARPWDDEDGYAGANLRHSQVEGEDLRGRVTFCCCDLEPQQVAVCW